MTGDKYPGRVLALDLGSRTIGAAISDESRTIAQPLRTIPRQRQGYRRDLAAIRKMASEMRVTTIVIGLPLTMDGRHGTQAQKVVEFAEILKARMDIPVILHDERLSTFEAQETLRDADLPRERWKAHVDAIAAAIILRDYLKATASRDETGSSQVPAGTNET